MAKPTGDAAGTLAALTLLADPALKTDLSAPALALATALDGGLGTALGLGASLSSLGVDKLAGLVGDLAGDLAGEVSGAAADIVGGVAEAVPMVGAVLGAALKLFNSIGSNQSPDEMCQYRFMTAVAKPTGSALGGGTTVPSDYFARTIDVLHPTMTGGVPPSPPAGFIVPSDGLFRSAFGMGLMHATEYAVIDESDLTEADWSTGQPAKWNPGPKPAVAILGKLHVLRAERGDVVDTGRIYGTLIVNRMMQKGITQAEAMRRTWRDWRDDAYNLNRDLWRQNGKSIVTGFGNRGTSADPSLDADRSKRGLPKEWRERFRAVRRGIEAAHNRPGDGGAGLWILYIDLLTTAFDRGYLAVPYLNWMYSSDEGLIPNGFPGVCAPHLAAQAGALTDTWRNTVNPIYTSGKAAKAKIDNLRVSGLPSPAPRSTPMDPIYLDHHATTPCDPQVVEAMLPHFSEAWGNPGSRHRFGRDAEAAVEAARDQLATVIGAAPEEILFTSGATESNNLALRGVLAWSRQRGGHLITCATEHSAVLKVAEQLRGEGFRCTVLPVDGDGLVDVDAIARALRPGERALVSIMAANNEIGTLQPIADIGQLCRERDAVFHCDATQAVGKIPFDVVALRVDLASISAHKMYGPKGVGALYVRRGVCLCPSILGGGQERGLRAGTSNVPGIVGMGVAAALAAEDLDGEAERLGGLRDRLLEQLVAGLGDRVRVNGSLEHRLAGNLSVCLAGVDGRALVAQLDEQGIAVSTGSACSRGITPSHVLRAIGRSEQEAWEAVRIGLGRWTTEAEIDAAAGAIVEAAHALTLRRVA